MFLLCINSVKILENDIESVSMATRMHVILCFILPVILLDQMAQGCLAPPPPPTPAPTTTTAAPTTTTTASTAAPTTGSGLSSGKY